MRVLINDSRFKGIPYEVDIQTYCIKEKETTLVKTNEGIEVYSCIPKDITKLLKVGSNIEIISCTKNGTVTAIKCTLATNQLTFRNPQTEEQKQKKAQQAKANFAR